jgi:Fe-S cluster assembly protein SufD
VGLVTPILSAGETALLALLPESETGDAARALLGAGGLPTRRDEAFKWSDLRAALADGVPQADGSAGMIPPALQSALVIDFAPDGLGIEGDKGEGLTILMEDSQPVENAGVISALAAALAPKTVVLTIAQSQAAPIFLRRHPGAPMRVRVETGEGVELTLIDTAFASAGLSTGLLEIDVATGAKVSRITLQDGGVNGVDILHTNVDIDQGGTYEASALAFGGRFARAETFVTLSGADATCRIDGAYLLAGNAHADATTRVTHMATGGTTRELFKGAVKDKARGVFQGKILVERAAQQTDARQNHHALMLTEGAEVDAKPELEIYADDVACAHGNTIGALDENALFYMRQRGIPLAKARALLVQAFVTEVLDGVAHEGARDWLTGRVEDWMKAAVLEVTGA